MTSRRSLKINIIIFPRLSVLRLEFHNSRVFCVIFIFTPRNPPVGGAKSLSLRISKIRKNINCFLFSVKPGCEADFVAKEQTIGKLTIVPEPITPEVCAVVKGNYTPFL